MKYATNKLLLSLLTLLCCWTSCQGQKAAPSQGLSYDLNHPEVIELSDAVHDISGIAYYAPHHSVFAIDDDHGQVYEIPLRQNPRITSWPIGKPQDFEDIVLDGNTLYVLSSKGHVAYMPLKFPIKEVRYARLDLKGKNDFETLFKDPAGNRLLMICKSCKEDSKHRTSVYALELNSKTFQPAPVATLHVKDVNAHLKSGSIENLKPSAAAVHPQSGEIYMLASANKLLLILDRSLKPRAAYWLDGRIFKQPEGIAFLPNGDLLISNEGGTKGRANILIFKKK